MTSADTGSAGFELQANEALNNNNNNDKLHIIEWNHLNLWRFYPLALASTWTVRCMLYPMSVVKSRLQLQKQNNVYRGMRHAFVDIVRSEGFTTLYKGFWVTVPQISASFVYSSVYEKLRRVLTVSTGVTSPPLVSAMAGGVASTCTQLIFVPTDIVAQYMMIHNKSADFTAGSKNAAIINHLRDDGLEKRWTLGLRVIRAVYAVDGLLGFYRGFFSSLLLYIPSSMVFWLSYYNTLNALKRARSALFDSATANGSQRGRGREVEEAPNKLLLLQAISGSCGGITAAICTNPLEVLRIRIQVHRTTYLETLRRLVVFEGLRVFTKGLWPRMLSNGIYSALIMIGYETVKRASVLPEFSDRVVW